MDFIEVNTKSKTDFTTLENKGLKYAQSGVNRYENLKAGDYLLKVKSIDGCFTYDTITVFEPQEIKISISNRDTIDISLGGIDTLKVVTNKQKLNFIWNTKEGFINEINKQLIEISPKTDILYRLTAIDSDGCKATAEVFVQIDKKYKIFLPNTFSPNGDNINDNFTIFADIKDVQKVESFKVFDRWGNEVFSNENFQPNIEAEGWNGNFRNEPAPLGVYTYFAKVLFKDGTTHPFKGDVELVR